MKLSLRFVPVFFLLLSLSFTEASCKRKIKRIDPNVASDLSGRWNDTDSRLVSEAMIEQALSGLWVSDYKQKAGEAPKIVVGLIQNKTHEHIETETFVKDLERACINSGKVRIIQGRDKRDEIRDERASQKDFASIETQKRWGKELGADFILQGTISSIVDQYKKHKTVFYQVDLELTDIETGEKKWIGNKKIKKDIVR